MVRTRSQEKLTESKEVVEEVTHQVSYTTIAAAVVVVGVLLTSILFVDRSHVHDLMEDFIHWVHVQGKFKVNERVSRQF